MVLQSGTIDLDGEWEFTYTPGFDFSSRGVDIMTGLQPEEGHVPGSDEFDAMMPVPGYWDDHLDSLRGNAWWAGARFNPRFRPIEFPLGFDSPDASLPYLIGTGWYRKEFYVPQQWRGGILTLYLGGVSMEGRVWVNRCGAGVLKWHSTPMELRIGEHIRFGEVNELLIAVSNTREGRIGCSIRGYPGRSGGITRHAAIVACGEAGIADFHVYRDGEALVWNAELMGAVRPGATLQWSINDRMTGALMGEGEEAAGGEMVGWETGTLGLTPWSDRSPVLYDISLSLHQDGSVTHTLSRPFGMRRLQAEGMGLLLNGKPVILRGATEHHHFPLTCTAPRDVAFYLAFLRKLKGLGFNWLRFHTWVPNEEYLEAADRVGMLMQIEPATGFSDEEWAAIVRLGRKHPSAVLYCCGNEEVLDEAKLEKLRQLSAMMRALAPDALFSPMEALKGIEYGSEEQMGPDFDREPYFFSQKRLNAVNEFSDVLASFAQGKLSYWSVSCDWRTVDEWMSRYRKPILSHEVCILGSYMNLDLEYRFTSTRTGPELYAAVRRNLERARLLDRASLYYQNSCRWLALLRKHCVENARKCANIAGYDLLGAIDHHWHRCGYPCGILNEFHEMKPYETEENVLSYNGESVLLLDHTNFRNYRCADVTDMALYSSLFGEGPLREGLVNWHVSMNGRVLLRREFAVQDAPNGRVSFLGFIGFAMPEVETPQKLTVHARLSGGEYELKNHWDFWVFPRVQPRRPKNVSVLDKLDPAAVELLKQGGRILLLGGQPFKTTPTMFQAAQSGRANGNMATVINTHPIFERFPHEGFCDWQFYSMLEGGCTVEFNDLPIAYEPILEVANSFKEILKKAMMFEVCIGDGKLFVCSLNMATPDPAADWLLDNICKYCESESFLPRLEMEPGILLQLLQKKHKPVAIPKTDIADDYNVRAMRDSLQRREP